MRVPTANQAGIGHIVVILAVLLVSVVGFVGYTVIKTNNDMTAQTDTAATTKAGAVPETINSKDDLQKTDTALENSASLDDSSLDDSSLDADLEAMR